MSDELDDIAKLLKSPPPPPSEGAKESAIFNAMRAFDEKNAPARQGTGAWDRLIHKLRDSHAAWIGEFTMKKAYILAGGAAAAIVTVTLLNTSMLTQVVPIPPAPSTVSNTVSTIIPENKTELSAPFVAQVSPEPATREQDANKQPLDLAKKVDDFGNNLEEIEKPSSAPVVANSLSVPSPLPPSTTEVSRATGYGVAASGISNERLEQRKDIPAKEKAAMMIGDAEAPYDHSYYHDEGRDKFPGIKTNDVKITTKEPVSTFSIDVDTSSYSFVRSTLNGGALPTKDAVRVEEMINYFPYEYQGPASKEEPFKANLALFATPWNNATKLLHIGIKGYEIEKKQQPHANLVFLLDTSGSMNEPNKLPLVKQSMKLLLDSLQADDTVSIVTYAGNAGTALEPTKAKDKAKILTALDNLGAGGSTAGAEGIRQAYQLAEKNFDKEGVNRVILATDGDFNVGITDPEELKSFVERKRETGIFLSVLGFGTGNYNDQIMQTLAQNGNGNAAYIDNLNEARKVLVEEAGSTLFPIAKDVKIQVEFNPKTVAEYRLIGYETRALNREDFNNDKVDAGDIGAGHTVTAIYEITPVGSSAVLNDPLRYQEGQQPPSDANDKSAPEYAFVKIRYKLPEENASKLISTPVSAALESASLQAAPQEARFATAVAAFGQLLRGDDYIKTFSYDDVINLAQGAKGVDNFGYRSEFISLVRLAKSAAAMKPLGQPASPGE